MAEYSRGIHELYRDDPVGADSRLWGRLANPYTRRGFLRGSGLAAMSAALGAAIPLAPSMPGGLIPAAFAQTTDEFSIPGKAGLRVLNDRPLNAETPAHLLDDAVTPAERLFVRNNGAPPLTEGIDPLEWAVDMAGEACLRPMRLTLGEIQSRFPHHTLQLQLECGGNGRAEFHPPAQGQSVDDGRRRVSGMDGRAAQGCTRILWGGGQCRLCCLRGCRPAFVRRHLETAHLPGRGGAQGDGG